MKHHLWTSIFLLLAGSLYVMASGAALPELPIRFGESVGVNALYDGKGALRFGIVELDKNGKELARTLKKYYGRNQMDSRTFVAVIKNAGTVKARAVYIPEKNSKINLRKITLNPLDREKTVLYSVKANRKLWYERTKGVNLIAGKPLQFSPSTKTYSLTWKGGTDATDLTDGKFGRDDDQIWFDGRAVAWSSLKMNLSILADLGAVKQVEKVVIRLAGGRISGSNNYSMFPPVLEVWVSKDGKDYFLARRLNRVGDAEKADSDWKTLYHLPQTTDQTWPNYVYPFELTVQADARYVVVRSPRQHFMVTDEMAIIQAEERSGAYNSAYKTEPEMLFHNTAILSSHYPVFHVAKDLYLPTLLKLDDKRPDRLKELSYELDLPSEITFYQDKTPPWPGFTRIPRGVKHANGRSSYRFGIKIPNKNYLDTPQRYGIGPFYFKTAHRTLPKAKSYVVLRTLAGNKILHSKKFPLEILEVKPVPELKKLSIGPAYFYEMYLTKWPEFLKTMRTIGFNTLRMDYLFRPPTGLVKKYYTDGVKANFKFRAQLSCTSRLKRYAATEKKQGEVLCQFAPGEKYSPNHMCPSYRGKYYQKLLSELRKNALQYPMEYISFDEEAWCFGRSGDTFTKCTRCDALRKKKNMTWKEFVPWVQADFLSGMYKAVKVGKNPPQVGFYNVHPGHIIGNNIVGRVPFNGFNKLYPAFCDEVQPSTYSSNTELVHRSTRVAYQFAKDPKRVQRWLSAGVGAYRSEDYGRNTTYQIWETFMNGGSGIQYYLFQSFVSPIDYARMAEALRVIAPFEEIIMEGELLESFRGNRKGLLYTARSHKGKMLVLAGNYAGKREADTVLPLKGKITDLESRRVYRAKGSFRCTIPAGGCRFFLVEK